MSTLPKTSLDLEVESCIYQYPNLYETRTDVLHHLFLVLGNGYYWNNGILVPKYRPGKTPKTFLLGEELIARALTKRAIINPYPWSDLNCAANMPEDADLEWREACYEVLEACPADYEGNQPGRVGTGPRIKAVLHRQMTDLAGRTERQK